MSNKFSQCEAKNFYIKVRDDHTVYVWGFNTETIITKETIDKAYRDYHSLTYNRAYYDKKLKEGNGKPGSDCSGMHCALSGHDTTAQGYYDEVKDDRKGGIDTLPLRSCILLFKGKYVYEIIKDKDGNEKKVKKLKINHTGIYLGDCMVIHMKSSKENCVYESVDKHGWTHWAYAPWIDYNTPMNDKPVLTRLLKMGTKGIDVKLLQDQLTKKGYELGKIDGDFGSKTKKAVEHFQADNDLAVDGIVGKQTAKKLDMIWKGSNY